MRTNQALFIVAGVIATASVAAADNPPKHVVPASSNGDLVVALCDGETAVEVKGTKAGQALPPDKARGVANDLMAQWKGKHPADGALWDKENLVAQATPSSRQAGGNTTAPPTQHTQTQEGDTYGVHTKRDEQIWRAATQQFVDRGNKVFHDAKELGGTVAISCDMCHPNAANTHPETYPKFQTQLGRVAVLRDMINWCIENPVRGKPLPDDDPKLKALEAYILAQRKGVALDYGKH